MRRPRRALIAEQGIVRVELTMAELQAAAAAQISRESGRLGAGEQVFADALARFGLAGGEPGACGRNLCLRADGRVEELPGRATVALAPGDRLRIETPGGGGHGKPG
jgi:N-methylhydantoinase B/oxoprolinase/acetone carboxylase alpha subunit